MIYYAFLRKEELEKPGEYMIERFENEDQNALNGLIDEAKNNGWTESTLEAWIEQLKKSPDFQNGVTSTT